MSALSGVEIGGVSYVALGDIRVVAYEFIKMCMFVNNRLSWHTMVYGGISLSLDLILS